ncbi:hypothetical protein D3C81_1724850 [compost metagenome]
MLLRRGSRCCERLRPKCRHFRLLIIQCAQEIVKSRSSHHIVRTVLAENKFQLCFSALLHLAVEAVRNHNRIAVLSGAQPAFSSLAALFILWNNDLLNFGRLQKSGNHSRLPFTCWIDYRHTHGVYLGCAFDTDYPGQRSPEKKDQHQRQQKHIQQHRA